MFFLRFCLIFCFFQFFSQTILTWLREPSLKHNFSVKKTEKSTLKQLFLTDIDYLTVPYIYTLNPNHKVNKDIFSVSLLN